MSTDTIADWRAGVGFKTQTSRFSKQLRPYACSPADAIKKIHIPRPKVDPPFVKEADMARSYKLLQHPLVNQRLEKKEVSEDSRRTNLPVESSVKACDKVVSKSTKKA